MESLLLPLDLYCERLTADFFSEPLNLFSNILFIVLACVSWRKLRQHAPELLKHSDIRILHGLLVLVGFGSFTFHGFANKLSQILDVVPIIVFMIYYLYLISTNLVGPSLRKLSIIALCFALSNIFFAFAMDAKLTNGSQHYFTSLIFLGIIWFYLRQRHLAAAKHMKAASIFFALALFFRSIDLRFCELFPVGTHFLWHIFVALVAYRCLQAIVVLYSMQTR